MLEHRFDELHELVHSGPSVPWRKSIRGRLHDVEQLMRAADNLRDAAREMRRSQGQRWSARRQRLLLLCALATAAAPYVVLLAHHG